MCSLSRRATVISLVSTSPVICCVSSFDLREHACFRTVRVGAVFLLKPPHFLKETCFVSGHFRQPAAVLRDRRVVHNDNGDATDGDGDKGHDKKKGNQ